MTLTEISRLVYNAFEAFNCLTEPARVSPKWDDVSEATRLLLKSEVQDALDLYLVGIEPTPPTELTQDEQARFFIMWAVVTATAPYYEERPLPFNAPINTIEVDEPTELVAETEDA